MPQALKVLIILAFALPAQAADVSEIRAKSPHLFHAETGYRIDRQRAPTPDDIPAPSKVIDAFEARDLLAKGAIPIDVFGASQSRYDELEGTWLVKDPRESLPGAIWLPEVGRGAPGEDLLTYFETNLETLTKGDKNRPLVIFCVADCWMSWNAAQRASSMGYTDVNWFRLGTDGWLDEGWELAPVTPVPVDVD